MSILVFSPIVTKVKYLKVTLFYFSLFHMHYFQHRKAFQQVAGGGWHSGAGSYPDTCKASLGYSTSQPAPCLYSKRRQQLKIREPLGPAHHIGDPDGVLGSWAVMVHPGCWLFWGSEPADAMLLLFSLFLPLSEIISNVSLKRNLCKMNLGDAYTHICVHIYTYKYIYMNLGSYMCVYT